MWGGTIIIVPTHPFLHLIDCDLPMAMFQLIIQACILLLPLLCLAMELFINGSKYVPTLGREGMG